MMVQMADSQPNMRGICGPFLFLIKHKPLISAKTEAKEASGGKHALDQSEGARSVKGFTMTPTQS